MNAHPDDILKAREARAHLIRTLQKPGVVLISLRANLPGTDKNMPEAFLIRGFLLATLPTFGRIDLRTIEGADGPTVLLTYVGNSAEEWKARTVAIETTHPLGRLADLDVYGESGPSLSRPVPRSCWICGRPAWDCQRNQRHSLAESLAVVQTRVRNHLRSEVSAWIEAAMRTELNLDPKLGLVTPFTNGSHPDMDYDLMIRAGLAIRPFLTEMFREGTQSDSPEDLFPRLREMGLQAEAAMRSATGGINAYKGLIFSFGLFLGATGYLAGHGKDASELQPTIRRMTAGLPEELGKTPDTFGQRAWNSLGFGGVRHEAFLGFPSVFHALPLAKKGGKAGWTMALVSLIGDLEDSVLLKRAGSMEAYREAKSKIAGITRYDASRIREVTAWCVEKNLSFGGAADLLVVVAFLVLFPEHYQI